MKKSFVLICLLFCISAFAFAKTTYTPLNSIEKNSTQQVVINENTRLYSNTSVDTPVLFTPEVGEKIQIVSISNEDWCKVKYRSKTAYARLEDLSDNYFDATFFNEKGSFATKLYNVTILLPYTIPAKTYTKIKKSLPQNDQSILDCFYKISNSEKGKPYKLNFYYDVVDDMSNGFPKLFQLSDIVTAAFPEIQDDMQTIVLNKLEIYSTFTYKDETKTTKDIFYGWELDNIKAYSEDFDGNTLLSFNGQENPYDDGTHTYFAMFTVVKEPAQTPYLQQVLHQYVIDIVAAQDDEYKITMPQDFKGVHNQIHVVLKGDFPKDFLYIYRNNKFYEQSNFGIINKKSVTYRNKPSLDGAKITGTIKEGTEVTVYAIKGTGKISGNTLDLWYKIAEYEEKYVNATAVNLYPFCLSGYNWEVKESTYDTAFGVYENDYGELYFITSNNGYFASLRAENIDWGGRNYTIIQQFADEVWENYVFSHDEIEWKFVLNSPEEKLPMGIKIGTTTEALVRQIFGIPSTQNSSGNKFYYNSLIKNHPYSDVLTFEFENGVVSSITIDYSKSK